MASSSDGYKTSFTALSGFSEPADQGIYEQSETQKYAIGQPYVLQSAPDEDASETQVFRYCKAGGTALSKALMTQCAAQIANHEEHVGGSGTVGAAGSREITVGQTMTTALTSKQYNGGTLLVNKATGISQLFHIVSHTNSVTPVFQLREKIRTALDTTSEITLCAHKNNGVIVMPTTATGMPVGVPLIDVTADYYFWAQTYGECPIIVDTGETLVIGENAGYPATISVAGAVGVPGATDSRWGYVRSVNAAAEPATIFLELDKGLTQR